MITSVPNAGQGSRGSESIRHELAVVAAAYAIGVAATTQWAMWNLFGSHAVILAVECVVLYVLTPSAVAIPWLGLREAWKRFWEARR